MDASNTSKDAEVEVENRTVVQYVSSTNQAIQYKTENTQNSGSIPLKAVIAIERGDALQPRLLYAPNKDDHQAESPAHVRHLYVRELPEEVLADVASPFALYSGRNFISVIVSIRSGTGRAEKVWRQLIQPIFSVNGKRVHDDYQVFYTASENTIVELTRGRILATANKGERQTVLLLSGDGGIVDIINALIGGKRSGQYRKPEIGLLPFGTGNALANSSGITGDDTFGLRTLLQGQAKEVPVFRATFSPSARLLTNEGRDELELDGRIGGFPVAHGAVVCSWGLHATLVACSDTTEYRKFGAERFQMAGKEALYPSNGSMPHAYRGKISTLKPGSSEWTPLERDEHGYVLATLCSHLEAGFHISPGSRPLDGKLRLVHFGRLSGDEAMGIMTKAYQDGQHVHDEKVRYEEIDGLRIEFAEEDAKWRRVCIDGKIIRVEKGGWVEVRMCAAGVVDLLVK